MNLFVKNKNKFFLLLFLAFFASFTFSFAATNTNLDLTTEYSDNPSTNKDFQIVPKLGENGCQDKDDKGKNTYGWKCLLQLVRNIMSLLLFLSASIAVLAFIYAGFLYLTAFGDMGKVEKAHGIFSKVIIGFLFVFLAWLIVVTILKGVGIEKVFYLLNKDS